jgi:hypothetical protein
MITEQEGTPLVQVSEWSRGLSVDAVGRGVVSHAGAGLLRLVGDRVGLTGELSKALARVGFVPVHDRGRVLSDIAVTLADGGRTIGEIAVLRDQAELFGPVASMPTAWRSLNEIDGVGLDRISKARARARRRAWQLIKARHGAIPAASTCYGDLGDTVVIRLDASIVIAHSEKINSAATFKKTYGFHPLTAWCDNTNEALAIQLRPGNAGSNTATDHLQIIDEAISQIPAEHRRRLLITIDGAGASHAVVAHLSTLNQRPGHQVHYSVGFALDARARTAIGKLPEAAWEAALGPDGEARTDAHIAELTGLLRHSAGGDCYKDWPADLRIIARREPISPGAQPSLFEQLNGHRFQIIATNTASGQLQRLEARHRVHARVEDRIRCAKQTGLQHLPSRDYDINTAWCVAVAIAADLLAWTQLLTLDGDLARAEPKTLRYRLLHTAARITRGQRRHHLKIPETWPWANQLAAAFNRALAIPAPT